MVTISPLPASLAARYQEWRAQDYASRREDYSKLAESQSPQTMVISCCDSRVHATDILHGAAGDFFIHRNIANLVPPYQASGAVQGTGAALEYAVLALRVKHILVLGHSACGGVLHCHDLCTGKAQDNAFEFVSSWLDFMRPAYERIDKTAPHEQQIKEMTEQSIITSLTNLQSFPFIAQAQDLSLHGGYHDIGSGTLSIYNPQSASFTPL